MVRRHKVGSGLLRHFARDYFGLVAPTVHHLPHALKKFIVVYLTGWVGGLTLLPFTPWARRLGRKEEVLFVSRRPGGERGKLGRWVGTTIHTIHDDRPHHPVKFMTSSITVIVKMESRNKVR